MRDFRQGSIRRMLADECEGDWHTFSSARIGCQCGKYPEKGPPTEQPETPNERSAEALGRSGNEPGDMVSEKERD
jgi:hypothetical protein